MAFGGVYSWQLSPWRRLPLPCRTHWAGSRTSWCGPRVGSQISTKVDWDVKMGVGGRSENGTRLCSAFSCVSLSWYVGRCCINASLSMWIMRHLVLLLAVAWCGNIGQLIVELICLGWASSFEFDFRCDDNKKICLMSHLLSDVFVRCRFPSAFVDPLNKRNSSTNPDLFIMSGTETNFWWIENGMFGSFLVYSYWGEVQSRPVPKSAARMYSWAMVGYCKWGLVLWSSHRWRFQLCILLPIGQGSEKSWRQCVEVDTTVLISGLVHWL